MVKLLHPESKATGRTDGKVFEPAPVSHHRTSMAAADPDIEPHKKKRADTGSRGFLECQRVCPAELWH